MVTSRPDFGPGARLHGFTVVDEIAIFAALLGLSSRAGRVPVREVLRR